ncbi:MAG TPA: RNA methyltransferase [Mycobacteriales bacterium]|jgi:TrmH family RNA methyltransferase|nr:RNA methyltransferase [Mycobacteriales bacterium]
MTTRRPEAPLFTERTPRVVAARRLLKRRDRDETGTFLVEGPQAIREALAAGVVATLFHTEAAGARHPELLATGIAASVLTERALAGLTETSNPQGLVAICSTVDATLDEALSGSPRLVTLLAEVRDPGNAGTVLRCSDAAGADAVILAGDAVDPYNGKCVRASAGSLFHLPVVRRVRPDEAVAALRDRGLQVLAADGAGEADLDDLVDAGELAGPTGWLFGNEAWGLPDELAALADRRVRIPIYGSAESLNLAAAAAVCLYASARAQR